MAILAALMAYWFAASVIRGFGKAPPDDAPAEVKPVDLRFECTVCGTLITMTGAPDAEPVAPRHCMEEMHLIAPVE